MLPYIGGGPIWKYYNDMMTTCNSYWWTNAIFINNFYPVNYDDKCMGWNWYLPVYLQLNFLLPFILLAYKVMNKIVFTILAVLLFTGFFVLNIALIVSKDIGAFPFFN